MSKKPHYILHVARNWCGRLIWSVDRAHFTGPYHVTPWFFACSDAVTQARIWSRAKSSGIR